MKASVEAFSESTQFAAAKMNLFYNEEELSIRVRYLRAIRH